jgi:hypothetical protein
MLNLAKAGLYFSVMIFSTFSHCRAFFNLDFKKILTFQISTFSWHTLQLPAIAALKSTKQDFFKGTSFTNVNCKHYSAIYLVH